MRNTLVKYQPRLAAFTLTELLVVISLIVLLLAIAVPAFSSMLYNNDRSLAENQFKIAIATARDQAIRSEGGDTAAVFLYQPGGKLRIVTCVAVAEFNDSLDNSVPAPGTRDVFVPVSIVNTIDLPRGWVVRGYLPPQSPQFVSGRWYGTNQGALEDRYPVQDGCWIFPESGFYDPTNVATGNRRSSFMVRFEAGTGALINSKPTESIVVDLAPLSPTTRSNGSFALGRLEQAADLASSVRRILDAGSNFTDQQKHDILGDDSPDTVLVRPVSQLAIVDERRMVQQFGQGAGQLNRATNSIYGDPANTSVVPVTPRIDTSLFGGATPAEVHGWVSQWIVGTYPSRDGAVGEARIFNVEKASGLAREVIQ